MNLQPLLTALANIGSVASIAVSGGSLAKQKKMWIYIGVGVSLAAILIMINRDKIFKKDLEKLEEPKP